MVFHNHGVKRVLCGLGGQLGLESLDGGAESGLELHGCLVGQDLTTGIIDGAKAPMVVERLLSPEMFNGWGIRTLASDMDAHNPASYHNGSVWPHDNAIIQVGLMRYGFVAEAQRVSTALLEAAEFSAGRLPELFCGFSREQFAAPVPYPTACSPQAWAATAPIMLVTTLMRYDPDVSQGGVWMDPVLPESYGNLHISNAPMGAGPITIDISGSAVSIQGFPVRNLNGDSQGQRRLLAVPIGTPRCVLSCPGLGPIRVIHGWKLGAIGLAPSAAVAVDNP